MKIKTYLYGFVISSSVILSFAVFAEDLYKITTKEMGITSFDYTITEIKRSDKLSVLRIPGFHKRSAAASRWMMCVYNDLGQKRGFKFTAVVYPELPSEDIIVGFPQSENEDIVNTLGPEFGAKNILPIMSVQKMSMFCGSMTKRKQ